MGKLLAFLMLALVAGPAASADEDVLSMQELASCAGQVQALREQSAHVTAENTRLEADRSKIERHSKEIDAARATLRVQDDAAVKAFQDRVAKHQSDIRVFNAAATQLGQDATAVNDLNRRYAQACATRNYRRSDFNMLPSAARAAMKKGTSDIRVPTVGPEP